MARRNQELSLSEFNRMHRLFHQHRAVSKSQLEKAEQTLNTAKDSVAQLSRAVQLFPYDIKQAQSELSEALAKLESAREDINRCKVFAPFDCRVESASIEVGQYVTAGQEVATLADESILEVDIAVDSRDVRQWLQFEDNKTTWFSGLKRVDCRIYWTEGDDRSFWRGSLHRAVRFNPKLRTLILAVRIDTNKSVSADRQWLPIVEGMFCRVEIPGRIMRNVIRLPSFAVSNEKTVYLAIGNCLKTRPVEVIRIQGDDAFVGSGLKPGDRVIVDRLVNPLENTLLTVIPNKKGVIQ